MDQSELGKNEEPQVTEPSSAELSEPEKAPESETQDNADNGVTETLASETAESAAGQAEPVTEADDTEAGETQDENTTADDEAAASAEAGEADTSDEESDAEQSQDAADDSPFKRGMLVEGTISKTSPTALVVDLGDGHEGTVPGRELELMTRSMLDSMREGEKLTVYVVNPNNHQGETVLSISQAQEELDWREAEKYAESKEVYDGKIGGYNKGGLIVRFGQLRGFVPQSQIADTRMIGVSGETPEERYGGMVNDDIGVKVMEVDRSRNRLILSERAAMREVRQRAKEALITELTVGEERDGTVVSLENFGAFVDIGGAEGLVHITEISWQHITHPRQVLDVGQEVRVRVINVDEDQNRIGLSIKALLPDPWDEIRAAYQDGALVRATVTKLTKFGAFAKLHGEPSVEGLIHISELSEDRVEHPRDVVNKGDELTLRVVKVDVKNRRLGLSLKQVNSDAYLDIDMERAYREAAEKAANAPAVEEAATDDDEEDVPAAGSAADEESDNGDDNTPEASAEAEVEAEAETQDDDGAEEDSDESDAEEEAEDESDDEEAPPDNEPADDEDD